jgi:hypothetical protein
MTYDFTIQMVKAMTWYAQQLFAEPRENVLSALRTHPNLRDSLYYIPHLQEWESEETVVDGFLLNDTGHENLYRTVRHNARFPVGGLLVAREFFGSENDHCKEWFGKDAVNFDALDICTPMATDPVMDYATIFVDAPEWWPEVAPPTAFLNELRSIAFSTKTVTAYYTCRMWGGDVECDVGWVWDGERQRSQFYRGAVAPDSVGKETTGFYTDMHGAYAIDQYGRKPIMGGDVLTLVLLHFGTLLSNGYFEPHTRSFPWSKYALVSK